MRAVSIGEMVVSSDPNDVLIAYGLGSCAAVCLYDPVRGMGGMVHSLLPAAPQGNGTDKSSAKFVDHGVPMLIEELVKRGAQRIRLVASLCGGAQMISTPGISDTLNIGARNIAAAEAVLKDANIPLRARATGGKIGRTFKLRIEDGLVTVKSAGQAEQPLR
jgi:chemotaxis protein CheD